MKHHSIRKYYLLALAGILQCPSAMFGASIEVAASDDNRSALEARRTSLSAAVSQGDAAAVAQHFSSDARLIVPGFDAMVGRDAIRQVWSFVLTGGGLGRLVLSPAEINSPGEGVLVETGTLLTFGKDGKERDPSHYLLVWKREGNEWNIFRDITSPAPVLATAPTADRVGFPENYRTKLKQLAAPILKRGLVQTPFGNESAAMISESGSKSYPNDALLVMEFAAAVLDDQGKPKLDQAGNPERGIVTRVDAMRHGAGFGEAYGKNRAGEWEFVSYRPDGGLAVPPAKTASCAECHVKAGAERDFVFPLK